ncbi:MAG: sulfatase-like hydrolase/transferase [Verrucomicrobia bacterium]|nr:sulfatase-like hydrolase/transferase [Verrucomicrobiota bacterium]
MQFTRRLGRWMLGVMATMGAGAAAIPEPPPNVVLLFADDLGHGDLACYGRRDVRTPHLDRLAAGGLRYTDFCVAQAVCSASRAALLTGCLPNRIGIQGALMPRSPVGLHPNEVTLGELFQSRGYATAAVGKWHLGDAPAFNPLRHGFDEWFGLPYSNDMWPDHPTRKDFPSLPLMDGAAVVDADVMPEDQALLTDRYTNRAVSFIQRSAGRPFFLYVAYSMPHVPLFVSDAFRDRSASGRYGDVIEELDASVGRIVEAIRAAGVEGETVVIFTSDNGPWLV